MSSPSPSTNSSSPIPSLYRAFFSTYDPFIAVLGILTPYLSPRTSLKLYNPNAATLALPPSIETSTLLHINAGFLAATTPLQVIMLRLRPHDVAVWKCLQGSILVQDLWILASVVHGLNGQKAWGLMGVDGWVNLGILAGLAVFRTAFLLGVGFGGGAKAEGKGKKAA